MRIPMTEEMANRVYDVLVETCGAPDRKDSWDRESFVRNHLGDDPATEWRFQGLLGFGGKFWREGYGTKWDVSYYSEDRTDERDKMVGEANKKLALLLEECLLSGLTGTDGGPHKCIGMCHCPDAYKDKDDGG